MHLVKSVCPYCGTGCGIFLKVNKNKVVGVLPDKNHPVSKGRLCIKGATLEKIVNSKDRLKYPLIRKRGKLVKTTWGNAIKTIAEKFNEIKTSYSPDALAVFSSAKCTNEENYLIQKFARVVLGTNNVDNCTRLCHAPTLSGLYEEMGSSAMTNSFEDLPESEFVLIFGSNPACTQPIGFSRIIECKKHGGMIATVDVRKSETAGQSDIFVQINPGTDSLFVAGLIKVILQKKLENKRFAAKIKGFSQLKESLKKYSLEKISSITGVSVKQIKEIATLYATRNSAIVLGMGITQQPEGVENILSIANLALITGNIGRPGSGINPLRGCNNVQGSCDMGCLPDFLPGYKLLDSENIKRLEKLWKVKLPIENGMTEVEIIESAPEKILGMYIIGENPMVSHPNLNIIEQALENLEFLVVQDAFMTETARMADIVLPVALFSEKTGTVTNTERRVQLIKRAVKPVGRTDMEIIIMLAEKMGFKEQFNYSCSEDVFNEIRKAVPQYAKMTYKKLDKQTMQWPNGKKIIFENQIPNARFYPIGYKNTKKDRKFFIISHRSLEHYNTGTFSRRVDVLRKIKNENILDINNEDARMLGVKTGDFVRAVSDFGEIRIKVNVTDKVPRCVVAVENHHYPLVNKLTGDEKDNVSKTPAFKRCFVDIEKD